MTNQFKCWLNDSDISNLPNVMFITVNKRLHCKVIPTFFIYYF